MDDRTEEFKEAFELYSDDLFRHCVMRLADRERAIELTQECFLRTWECIARGDVIRQLRPFFYQVLNNLIIDEYRKRKTVSLDAMLEDEDSSLAVEGEYLRDKTNIFEESAIKFDAKKALEAVSFLPKHYQAVIIMRYIDDLTPTEIAKALGESENAVSVRLHRGIRKLKDLLTSHPDIRP